MGMKFLILCVFLALCCVGPAMGVGNKNNSYDNSSPLSVHDIMLFCLYRDDVRHLEYFLDGGMPVDHLFHVGLNPNVPDKRKVSLICAACMCNATNCLKKIIAHGVDLGAKTIDGTTVYHYAAHLSSCDSVGIDLAEAVLARTDMHVDQVNASGATPLLYALKNDRLIYAKWLVSKGADFNRMIFSSKFKTNVAYMTALSVEVPPCSFEAFSMGLSLKYNKNFITNELNELLFQVKPYADTCFTYRRKLAELVKCGADINSTNKGSTLMHKVLMNDAFWGRNDTSSKIDAVKFLLENGFSKRNLEIVTNRQEFLNAEEPLKKLIYRRLR